MSNGKKNETRLPLCLLFRQRFKAQNVTGLAIQPDTEARQIIERHLADGVIHQALDSTPRRARFFRDQPHAEPATFAQFFLRDEDA